MCIRDRNRRFWKEENPDNKTSQLPHTTVYITHPWADFTVDMSTVGIASVPKRSALEYIDESFPKTYRSVLAPFWLSSNRAWKTAPGVCDIHHRVHVYGNDKFIATYQVYIEDDM